MTHPASTDVQDVSQSLVRVLRDGWDDEATAPIRAGLRARAIADACEQFGLAAVLIDRIGRVLHAGAAATAIFDDELTVTAGHLVGSGRSINQAVQGAVTAAIGGDCGEPGSDLTADSGLTITGMPYRDASPFQLLCGVLVLSRAGTPPVAAMASLRSLLNA